MKFTKEHLYYIYAENNQHNRDRLSKLCNQFGINCLSNEGFKFLEVYSCDNGVSDDFELLDTDTQDLTSRFLSSDDIDEMLHAAALEEKKPRTKVEYVKCNFSREWEAVKYYNEEGELFVIDFNGNYSNVNDISGAWYEVVCRNYHCIYRRIETPITEREAFIEALQGIWFVDGFDSAKQFDEIVDSGLFKLVN